MINEDRKKLYDALSSEYDLGTYEEFERNIGDSVKRRKLYDAAIADYDLGDYESYSQRIGPTHKESLDAFTAEHGSWLNDFEARDSAETNMSKAGMSSGVYVPAVGSITGEERKRYMELHKQEEALKKAWFTSDEYLAQKDADALFLSNVQKDLSRQRVEYAQANPPIKQEGLFQINPYAVRGAEADTELERFATASRLMDDAIKMHNAPSRYDDKNVFLKFGKGAGDVLSDADFWTAGLTEIADNLGVRDVLSTVQEKLGNLNDLSEEAIENILSPAEKAVLQAWAINTQEQLKRKDDLSRAYQAGQGATESLGFMAEFALTGGIGKAATEGVEQMVKWLGKKALTKVGGMTDDVAAKVLKETGEKIAQSAVGKYGVGLAESLAEAAGRTGVMPSTFRNISEKATEIETDENGNNYLVKMNDAFAKGYVDSFIENLSEGGRVNALGTLFGDVAGKIPAYKKMVDKFSHTKASELWDAFNSSGVMNALRAGGWHGLGEEYLEEWYGNALRTLTGVDKEALKDFATVDNQIVTLTSFLPMTIFGGTVSTAQVLSANKDLEKKAAALKSALMERGYDEAQANNMIDMMRGAAPAEVSETLTPIVNSVANRNTNEAAALMKPVGEFAAAVQRWQSFNTKYNYQEQEQRDGLRVQMEENLGQFWQQDENGRQTVQRGVNEKGEVVYMLGKPSAEDVEAGVTSEVAAVTSDGRKVFVNPSEYQLEDELEMNTFLGNEIMAEKGNQEQARMIEEKEAKIAAIRETAVPGTAVNIGTAEAPIQAIVLQRNPDGVIVNTPDGQTRQMTYEEFGNYVGVNAVPMTDAQIDEHEADVLTADRAQREAALDQEYENEDAALEELSEAEDEIEQAVDSNIPLPLKADGSVDQTALWNKDPERWAQWNDEQRQDGGANSLAYVGGAIAKEQAKIAELQAAYAAESDFDARDAIEKEIADTQARVERLGAIQQGYVTQAEAAAAPVVEAEPVAPRVASQMNEQEKSQIDSIYERKLRLTTDQSGRVAIIQEYVNRLSEGSMPAVVITKDNYKEAMRAANCPEALITRVGFFINAGQNIGAFIANGHIFLMEEGLPSMEEARISYVHERQHAYNSTHPEFIQAVVEAVNGDRSILLSWLSTFMDSYSLETYMKDDAFRLADEVIARCMEIAYTTEDFSVALQSKGISSEVISVINEIDNEQRLTQSYLNARRGSRSTTHDNVSGFSNVPENGRNSGQVSGGILEQQEARPSANGNRGAQTGEAGEGAEVISEEQLSAPNSGEAQQITAADGEVLADTDGKGGVRFSIRTWNEGGRDYLAAWLANDTTLTDEEKADILARMDEFYKNALLYSDTYAPFGTWSDAGVRYDNNGNPLMSVIKANGDYAMNLDFSLVCKKRRPLNRLLRTLVNRNAFATYTLRERELAEINWILQEHGFEVACALCFVDSKRYRVTGVADVFAALYNRLVKSIAPEGVQIAHFNYNNNPNVEAVENGLDTMSDDQLNWDRFDRMLSAYKPGSVEHKVAQYLREHPEARKLVDATDFIEAEGFESVKENNPDLLKFYNMKKGTGGPKASFGDVQYLNDILKKEKSFNAEKAYAVGGVRLQSFSDFVPHMYFDYMQLFAELAAKKLPLHAYTKEVLFAKIFGLTGAKINMSLVPAVVEGGVAPGLDAEGNYAWADPVTDAEGNVIQQGQSFPYDEAMAIQQAEGYSKNCGVIAVGISDAHIEKMLDDPNIPFIIPYHKSSLNAIVARMTNIDQYKDYTNVQNTRKASGSKLDKGTKDFNFNEYLHSLGESGTPQQAAQAYLEWCRENNYKPKFSQFAYHPNYYKLLQDFNTIDLATGEYAPQGAVTMTFPTEESAFGNVETLIQQGLQEDAELEEKMEQEIDGIADQVLSRLEEISKEPKMSEKQQARKMAELADERMAKIKERASGPVDIISEAEKAVDNELRMRVIGEVGARRMDDAVEATTMMDNLAVAKEMEEAGKDAKAIKMATGWERGADNLWRYEMEDFEFIGKPGRKKTFKLSDLIADQALFTAYPELKDIKVKYTKLAKGKGGEVATEKGETVIRINEDQYRAQNPVLLKAAGEFAKNHPEIAELVNKGRIYAMTAEQREIYLNELRKPFIENELYINEFGGKGTLVHEIQHVIQDIENFAQGGNSAMVDTSDPAVRNEIETLQRVLGIEIENANELVPVLKDIFTRGRMAELSGDRQTALALKAEWNKKKAEWDNHSANINAIKKDLRKFRTLGLEGYRKLAGEVESRNAEARMSMSYNERRNSLLSETEDVAREDQIFLRDNVMMRGDEYMASQALVPGHKKGQPMLSDAEMMTDVVSFRISKNTKATIEKWCDKAELDQGSKEGFINYLDTNFEDTTEQLCAAKWYLNGKINLPDEDEYKVRDAVKVAKQNKVDALSYASPMDILNTFGQPKSKVKPINPDTVKEFSNKKELAEGIVVYDVQDDFEGQAAVRKIIDTHWGEDANPWCLAARTNGDLERAKEMWQYYSKYPKRIAFKNGRLLAFYASADEKTWWDRKDEPHTNIPYSVKSKEGEYEVSTNYELKEGNKKATKVSVGKSDGKGRTAYFVKNKLESAAIQDGHRNLFYNRFFTGATLSDATYGAGDSIEVQYGPYMNVTQVMVQKRPKDGPSYYARVGYGQNGVRAISFVEGARSWDIRYGLNGDRIFVGRAQLNFDLTNELSDVYSGAYHMYRINDEEYEIARGTKKVGIVKKGEKVTMQMLEAFGEDGAPAGALLDFINDMGWNRADYPYPNPADADLLRRDDEVREMVMKAENDINEVAGGRYLSSVPAIRFRITPEQDKAYMDAVKAGDMETAQRMVDEAAEAAGYTIRGDHGRVSKFSIFDRNKANPEGNWGQGFYFSNNEEDVENNYATVDGPDLEVKIEREVERRVNLAEMNEEFNEDGEVDEFAIREAVEDEFITSEPNVVHAAIKMDNPFVVGHGMVEIGEDGLGHYDMQETYLTAEYETDEDGEVDYSIDPTGTLVDLVEALNEELSEYEWVNINAYDILSNNIDGMTAGQFEKDARELLSSHIDSLVNDNGESMSSEIIRAAIERAGFDGIVDNTVNQKFGTARRYGRAMDGMDGDTRHYIAFQSSQIKETDPVTYDNDGNVIPLSERFNPENEDIRFRATEITPEVRDEMNVISAQAFVNGTYLKAPNGADTKLTPEQWALVRTKAFKAWFGDWEKAARIQKLLNSEPVIMDGNEHEGKYELNRDSAQKYILNELRHTYTIADTNERIKIVKKGAKKVTSHSMGNDAHMRSIAIIPEIIRSAIFITEMPANKADAQYDSYRYYVCGLEYAGESYTVKMTVGVKNGDYYYDHTLTDIEKGKLLDMIESQQGVSREGFTPTGNESDPSYALSDIKDKKLVSILQTNSSKVVDENGEPMVVYHGSPNEFSTFDEDMIGENTDSGFYGRGFYFATTEEEARGYGKHVIPAFLKMQNPLDLNELYAISDKWDGATADGAVRWWYGLASMFPNDAISETTYASIDGDDWTIMDLKNRIDELAETSDTPFADATEEFGIDEGFFDMIGEEDVNLPDELTDALNANGYDGVINAGVENNELVALRPNQIKSATDNTGEFSAENNDIRFRTRYDVNTNPTEAQKEAGNYKMGHIRLDGYNITIENPKGSVRRGTDSKGNAWENTLNNDYGYIRGTEGVDGDHIDVYLSDNPTEGNVFVVDQVNPETREFDEHKVMYGFSSAEEAREAYLANFSEGWNGLGTITEVSKDEFKKWIDSSHRKTKPFSEYKSVRANELQATDESDLRYRVVTNQETLDRLNSESTIKVYRAMQLIDGKLYPPMSAKVDGELRQPIELGQWEEAEERPDLVDEKGRFKLDKGNKSSLKARYNPYFHTSPTPLNDQFSSAQTRPELVTVEVEVPESELTSGYKAEKAKDSVGKMEWKAGVVQSKLSGTRTVILSRWDKPVRIVPDSEVADVIVDMFEGRDITMPSNVVTPSLRAELEKRGVPFVETDNQGNPVEEVSFRVTGTPTDELVTNGLQLTPAQTAEVAANIFAALPEESRKKITDGLNGNILGLKDAILQIPTSLASKENWNEEDKQMADVVAEEMTKMAGEMTRPFSAEEGLWLLYNNLNKGTDLISQASRALVQRNLGFDAETLARQEQAKEGVRFRTIGDATSNAQASLYNRGAVNVWTRLKESYVDMMASAEKLVKAIEKRSGKVAQGFENILLALNQQSSRGLAAMESYTQRYLNPMFDEIRRIMDETKMKYEDVVRYVILKHGLERNKKLAQRDARAHYQEIYDDIISKITGMTAAQKRTYLTNAQLKEGDAKAEFATLKAVDMSAMTDEEKREHKKKLAAARKAVEAAEEHLKRAQKIASLSEQEAQDELDKIFEKIENGTDSVFKEMRENDYSGISSMFYDQLGVDRKNFSTEEQYQAALMDAKKDKYSSLADVEAAAEAEVASFEGKADTKELWKRINAATKETLRQQYEANMISKDQYDSLRNMFEYYVPLRGFKDNTAEDMYTYYRKPNSTGYTKPILGAEGRKTEAESPFGWIAAMAGSAIASNVKNEAKLALYYFVSNRPENGIATISKTWFVDSGEVDERGKKIFKPAYPPFSEDLTSDAAKDAYEAWQENMRELQKKGQAYEAGQRLNLGNAVVNISDANKPEHIVNVKVGGKDYTIIINGNPRAAQAINGDLNIEGTAQDYSALFGPVLRWMSSVNTSYNPEFWITNMMRDMAFTMMAVNIKEDPAYRRKFKKNYLKAFKVVSLVAKNEKGTIGDSYLEEQYKDFVKYGGVTGYTQIKDSETWEQEIENYLSSNDPESIKSGKVMRGMKTAFHAAHRFGESLEQVSRFAAFLTARETGKSINEAINDAKEITVNFNRKGSGKMITLEEAKYLTGKNGQPLTKFQQWMAVGASSIAPLGRRFIMFFNAAIQGLNATYKLMKKNPKRFTGWALGYAAVGMMNAVLHAMLDDDDDYLDIPQYERRNSLMIGGNGAYFKWALPQEARAFYALGDLAVETVMGRNPHQNFLGEALKIGTEILPVNPSEGWKAFMPSVAIPFIELALNEDYKGAPIYNEQKWLSEEEKERTAKWSNAYQGTGWTYVKIAQGLNFITGGDKHDAGWINLQPEKLEHLVQSAFGGTIRTADKFINTISAAINPEEPVTIRQTPFLNRFLTINDERFKNVHVNDVFDYYKADAEHALTLEKQYIKDRDMDSLTKLRSSDEYQWAKIYGKYKKPLKAIQNKIKVSDGTAEKKELMKQQDELKKRMIKEISEL